MPHVIPTMQTQLKIRLIGFAAPDRSENNEREDKSEM
jgi:hypothetical protein